MVDTYYCYVKVVDLFAPDNVKSCEWLPDDCKKDAGSLDACLAR